MGSWRGLANDLVVLTMRADPEPMDSARNGQPDRSVVEANSNAVETPATYSLEVQGPMRWVGLQQRKAPMREGLDFCGKRFKTLPEPLGSCVLQSSRTEPARQSARASAAIASSLPAAASCSICLSQASASNSANQRRNSASSEGGSD